MRRLDAFFIERAEQLAQFIQLWTGIDCFMLMRACFWIAAGLNVFGGISYNQACYFLAGIFIANGYFDYVRVKKIYTIGFKNVLKILPVMRYFRFGWLAFACFQCIHVWQTLEFWHKLSDCDVMFIWAAYLFMACDPLPPGENKLRQFIDSLSTQLQPIPLEI